MSKKRHGSIAFGKGKRRLVIYHVNKPIGGCVIGMVRSSLFPCPVAVCIDDGNNHVHFAHLACAENGKTPRIVFERELFYDVIRGLTDARMILLHELGHFYHQHYLRDLSDEDAFRWDCVELGEVDPNELEADRFAAFYLGVEKTIEGLQCLQERICRDFVNDDRVRIATKELQLRIRALSHDDGAGS